MTRPLPLGSTGVEKTVAMAWRLAAEFTTRPRSPGRPCVKQRQACLAMSFATPDRLRLLALFNVCCRDTTPGAGVFPSI
eukprot:5282120-Pleurochrysis_carterae.AAC.2